MNRKKGGGGGVSCSAIVSAMDSFITQLWRLRWLAARVLARVIHRCTSAVRPNNISSNLLELTKIRLGIAEKHEVNVCDGQAMSLF